MTAATAGCLAELAADGPSDPPAEGTQASNGNGGAPAEAPPDSQGDTTSSAAAQAPPEAAPESACPRPQEGDPGPPPEAARAPPQDAQGPSLRAPTPGGAPPRQQLTLADAARLRGYEEELHLRARRALDAATARALFRCARATCRAGAGAGAAVRGDVEGRGGGGGQPGVGPVASLPTCSKRRPGRFEGLVNPRGECHAEARRGGLGWGMWANPGRNPRLRAAEWRALGVTAELPRQLAASGAALRVLVRGGAAELTGLAGAGSGGLGGPPQTTHSMGYSLS
jgi:hypothetical protein